MSDRISYINSINFHGQQDDVAPMIIRYFDETMGLYSVIGDNIVSIDATSVDGSIIFYIKLKSISDADVLENSLEKTSSPIIVYGRAFSISYTRYNDLEVNITVVPVIASPI
jgi:hypothetical protein